MQFSAMNTKTLVHSTMKGHKRTFSNVDIPWLVYVLKLQE